MNQTSPPSGRTVREAIRAGYATLTQSEGMFAQDLLDNYPAAGLALITITAANAEVSTLAPARLVQKPGFKGYLQALLAELEDKASRLTQRRDEWVGEVLEVHMLNRLATAIGVTFGTGWPILTARSLTAPSGCRPIRIGCYT